MQAILFYARLQSPGATCKIVMHMYKQLQTRHVRLMTGQLRHNILKRMQESLATNKWLNLPGRHLLTQPRTVSMFNLCRISYIKGSRHCCLQETMGNGCRRAQGGDPWSIACTSKPHVQTAEEWACLRKTHSECCLLFYTRKHQKQSCRSMHM